MITRDEITAIIAECMAMQMPDAAVEYDTEILIDSFSFVWLQHTLGQRFGFELEPPDSDVLESLTTARSVHRYLARISPDRFAAAE
jgi:hypothetical protein